MVSNGAFPERLSYCLASRNSGDTAPVSSSSPILKASRLSLWGCQWEILGIWRDICRLASRRELIHPIHSHRWSHNLRNRRDQQVVRGGAVLALTDVGTACALEEHGHLLAPQVRPQLRVHGRAVDYLWKEARHIVREWQGVQWLGAGCFPSVDPVDLDLLLCRVNTRPENTKFK